MVTCVVLDQSQIDNLQSVRNCGFSLYQARTISNGSNLQITLYVYINFGVSLNYPFSFVFAFSSGKGLECY